MYVDFSQNTLLQRFDVEFVGAGCFPINTPGALSYGVFIN
jgi:hypothetical protein